MASGHRQEHNLTTAELDDLLDQALASPKVKARLARPFKLVTDKDIPLLGSSSVGGHNVYLDRHLRYGTGRGFGVLPIKGRLLDVKPGLIRHERMEQAVEDVFGWPYMPIAHPVATQYEHRYYREKGFDPADVEAAFAPFIRSDERERLEDVPTDLDLRPMLHDAKLLERTRSAQDRHRVSHESVRYVTTSPFAGKHCGVCSMFVNHEYGGPACTLVKSQIAAEGYCRRFHKGALG